MERMEERNGPQTLPIDADRVQEGRVRKVTEAVLKHLGTMVVLKKR
jgi:hypothetical protein